MQNRGVLRLLRTHLEPVLLPLGFSRSKGRAGNSVAWFRPSKKRRFETIWCQMDEWPFDPWIGTCFTLEFQQAGRAEPGMVQNAKRARLPPLLTAQDRQRITGMLNGVVQRCRIPSVKEYSAYAGWDVSGEEFFSDVYRDACRAAKRLTAKDDVWFRFLDENDVHDWGVFLAGVLPSALERFEKLDGDDYRW